jgi:hypothetical protein
LKLSTTVRREISSHFPGGGGGGESVLINDKGVVITVSSEQTGTQLTLGPAEMSIELK